jgi:hypothetical protein
VTCLRCQGLMLPIVLEDSESTTVKYDGWQCVLCGDVIDLKILANRGHHAKPTRSGARPPGSIPSAPKRKRLRT